MAIPTCPTTSTLPFLLMTLLLGISECIFAANLSPTLVAGQLMTFTCTSLGFYSQQDITVTWFKNGKKSQFLHQSFSSRQNNNFHNITKVVQVPFTESQVMCEVKSKLFTSSQTRKPQTDAVNNSLSSRGPLTTTAPAPFPAMKTQSCQLLLTVVFLGWKILLLVVLSAHYIFKRRLV